MIKRISHSEVFCKIKFKIYDKREIIFLSQKEITTPKKQMQRNKFSCKLLVTLASFYQLMTSF